MAQWITSSLVAFASLVFIVGIRVESRIEATKHIQVGITEDEAIAQVWKIDEITTWCQLLKDSSDSVKPIAYAETSPRDGEGGWTFYVGEDHGTHTAIKGRYFVDAATGEVQVWDGSSDGFVPVTSKR